MKVLKYFIFLLAISFCLPSFAERNKYPLEAFDLGQLKIDEIQLKGKCAPFASVRDPNGYIHRVFIDQYIGKNFGLVKAISKQGIQLREVIQNSEGEWIGREAFLAK